MLKDIYPNAKIIFNIRDYNEYIKSCHHKWTNTPGLDFSTPIIGLHWYNLNSTIMYDLNKYYPNQFTMVYHNELYRKSSDEVQKMLNNVLKFCNLNEFNFDLGLINRKHKYLQKEEGEVPYNFNLITDLVNFEKALEKK